MQDDWTQAAAEFAARHEPIENFHYEDDVRIAVNFTADFDAMLFRRVLDEPPMQKAKGEFGGRVGIWRLIELFDAHEVKATFFTPGRICELYPQALAAAAASGHEIADHMWEHRTPAEPELQADHLAKSAAALEKISGRRPVGTRSYYRQKLTKDAGYIYNSSETASRRPYYVVDEAGEGCLLQLPLHFGLDDAQFFNFGWFTSEPQAQRITDPDRVFEMWWSAFLQQYQEGAGYLNICVHPFVSGRALRIDMLERLIVRMKGLPGVWFPTCEQLARHCLKHFPPQALKR
jgi:peptidoglycan/xylan/chitin deacetylase (PgdA/CDA1 family)